VLQAFFTATIIKYEKGSLPCWCSPPVATQQVVRFEDRQQSSSEKLILAGVPGNSRV